MSLSATITEREVLRAHALLLLQSRGEERVALLASSTSVSAIEEERLAEDHAGLSDPTSGLRSTREAREPVYIGTQAHEASDSKRRNVAQPQVRGVLAYLDRAAALGEPNDGEATGEATNRRSLSPTRRARDTA